VEVHSPRHVKRGRGSNLFGIGRLLRLGKRCVRVKAMERPRGACRSAARVPFALDLGDLSDVLAAVLGVTMARFERAIRSLEGLGRVHVSRWAPSLRTCTSSSLRGPRPTSATRDAPPPHGRRSAVHYRAERSWRENLALVASWLDECLGRAIAEPPRIEWRAPRRWSHPRPMLSLSQESRCSTLTNPTAHRRLAWLPVRMGLTLSSA
jgi:hypothetical protein